MPRFGSCEAALAAEFVSLGLLAWLSFAWLAIRARSWRLAEWSLAYALATALTLTALDAGREHRSPLLALAGAALGITCWLGAMAQLSLTRHALRRRIADADLVAIARAEDHARRLGRTLVTTEPRTAAVLGVGRPDRPGARSFGVVDVNRVGVETLAGLPGLDRKVAQRIVALRERIGGFRSVAELGALCELAPPVVDELAPALVFGTFVPSPHDGVPAGGLDPAHDGTNEPGGMLPTA